MTVGVADSVAVLARTGPAATEVNLLDLATARLAGGRVADHLRHGVDLRRLEPPKASIKVVPDAGELS